MVEPSSSAQESKEQSPQRLDSWKEVAAYLNRDVTTVQRWEKREGMPIHRHLHDKRGSVYALSSELDVWLASRTEQLRDPNKTAEEEETRRQPQQDIDQRAPVTGAAINAVGGVNTLRMGRWLAVSTLTGVALVIAIYFVYPRSGGHTSVSPIKSLAVLPFKNLSGDPAQDYLADGMTEALIGRLAGIRDLRVISHTSVMRFRDPRVSVPEIAKTLGVDGIVEGSVMRQGNHIRVTAQLIRGATDEHFWSETYDRELRDVLGLQSELAQAIGERIRVTITGKERERLASAPPVAPEVYESYLQGRFVVNKHNSKAGVEEGVGFFEDAINRDPTFAPAYVGLAHAYRELGTVFLGGPPSETRPKVMSAAREALELDPDFAEAHALLAEVLQEQWHWPEAEAEYRRALELNPNDADTHGRFSVWLVSQGRTDDAVASVRRGRELDPIAVPGTLVAWILFQSRRYEEAERELHSALTVQPDDATAFWYLGFVLLAEDRASEAVPFLERGLAVSDRSPGVIGVLIRGYNRAGRRDGALRLLAELKARRKAGYVPAGAFVNAYLGLGENDQAFVWLEEAYKEQSNILQFLKVHPYFDPIRGDPRFADLLRRVGLS
jgi:TolB-like protein/Tfp pilus assembly protein PilF